MGSAKCPEENSGSANLSGGLGERLPEPRPEGSGGASHTDIWRRTIPSKLTISQGQEYALENSKGWETKGQGSQALRPRSRLLSGIWALF
jgi:hypothetical protein